MIHYHTSHTCISALANLHASVLINAHCVESCPLRLIIALGHTQTVNSRIMSSAPSESVWTLLTTPHNSIPPADSPSWSGCSVNGGRHCWGCIGSSRIDHDVRLPSHSCSYYLYPAHNEVLFTRQLHQKHSVTFEATMPTYSDKPMAFTFVTTFTSVTNSFGQYIEL